MTHPAHNHSGHNSQRPAWIAVAVSVALALIPFLGWTKSGSVVRNSFQTFRAAQTLGLDQLTPLRVAWFVIPVFPLLVAALVIAQKHRLAGVTVLVHSILVLGAGTVILFSGVAGSVGALTGTVFGLLGMCIGLRLIVVGGKPQ